MMGVYIDGANLLLSARDVGFDLNVVRLVQHVRDVYRDVHVMYFSATVRAAAVVMQELKQVGVEIVKKEVYRDGTTVKANCDVEIAHRMTLDIERRRVDSVLLLSGDGDFVSLVDYAAARGMPVRVMAFDARSCSIVYKRRAFTRLAYVHELGDMVGNKKPPAST